METKQILNWDMLLSVIFTSGSIGIALKFLWIFYQSGIQGYAIHFPWFPNYLDSTFLCLSVLYFMWGKLKGMKKSNESHK